MYVSALESFDVMTSNPNTPARTYCKCGGKKERVIIPTNQTTFGVAPNLVVVQNLAAVANMEFDMITFKIQRVTHLEFNICTI